VALLSLTAMVDMFTVLVIFLLQNYNATGQVIYIPKEVTLPKADEIKELKPAVVVTLSSKDILVDKEVVALVPDVKAQTDWMIPNLKLKVEAALVKAKADYEKDLKNKIQQAVMDARGEKNIAQNPWNKITIQSDKAIDFLTVKKVMYTVTEAGGNEINFAVMKQNDK
jgi:biopolymer transport protein ExbD